MHKTQSVYCAYYAAVPMLLEPECLKKLLANVNKKLLANVATATAVFRNQAVFRLQQYLGIKELTELYAGLSVILSPVCRLNPGLFT